MCGGHATASHGGSGDSGGGGGGGRQRDPTHMKMIRIRVRKVGIVLREGDGGDDNGYEGGINDDGVGKWWLGWMEVKVGTCV